jgi:hypothetical protein
VNRAIAPLHLDAWLENWGRWLGCDLKGSIEVSDIDYNSPQKNHWEPLTAYVKPLTVHEYPAALVEKLVHANDFEHMWSAALRAAYYLWPIDRLRADHVPPTRWDGRRAHSAGQALPTFQASITNGKSRLARDLYVWRHALPSAA